MKLDSKEKTKSKHRIRAHEISIVEINKFFDMYYNFGNACEAIGVTRVWGWTLKNGFYCIQPELAEKMWQLSGGIVSYDALMVRKEKINTKKTKKSKKSIDKQLID